MADRRGPSDDCASAVRIDSKSQVTLRPDWPSSTLPSSFSYQAEVEGGRDRAPRPPGVRPPAAMDLDLGQSARPDVVGFSVAEFDRNQIMLALRHESVGARSGFHRQRTAAANREGGRHFLSLALRQGGNLAAPGRCTPTLYANGGTQRTFLLQVFTEQAIVR